MFDVNNIIIMLLCVYYQENKKLGEIVEINGILFRLVLSSEPLKEESGICQFRINPISTVIQYLKGTDNEQI